MHRCSLYSLWRDCVGAGHSPFPASATAEGGAQRVFNGAPSREEREKMPSLYAL
jgi:hypothetical protein